MLTGFNPKGPQKNADSGGRGRVSCLLRIQLCLLFMLMGLIPSIPVASSGFHSVTKILVLYPESSAEHQRLYGTIIDGMQNHESVKIISQRFGPTILESDIQRLANEAAAQAVITIGPTGRKLADNIQIDVPVISGAHVLAREDQAAISLAADPRLQFARLKQLKPSVNVIYVIHNRSNTGWLIDDAKNVAKQYRLKLIVEPVEDVKQITSALQKIIKQADPNRSAIWLPLDPVLPMKLLLPELLRAAWEKNLVVFSNNPVDVQKGALFAMYPDYSKIGIQMVETVIAHLDGKTSKPEASRYLKSAVNSRTASHLGINLDVHGKDFNLFFPERL